MSRAESLLQQIRELRTAGDSDTLSELLAEQQAADLADVFAQLPELERTAVLDLLSSEQAGRLLDELEAPDRVTLLAALSPERAGIILGEMPSDEAADVLADLPASQARQIIERMQPQEAQEVEGLLRHPEATAGGLMATEFVALPHELTVEQTIERLRELEPEAETIYYIYVLDADQRLVGVLSLRELIVADPTRPISEIMQRELVTVPPEMDQEEVARIVSKYGLLAVPVADAQGRMLGIVTVDDVMDVLEDEAGEDIYRLAGVTASPEAPLGQPLTRVLSSRLPWLALLLGCGGLAAWLLRGPARMLGPQLVVACFLPVFVMVAGNAGTQSVSALVSGLAGGELTGASLARAVSKELRAALIIAIICGVIVYLIGESWSGMPAFALAVGLAVLLSLLGAGLLGSLLPVACRRWGADPALAAGPLVGGLSDLSSVVIYVALTCTLAQHWVR